MANVSTKEIYLKNGKTFKRVIKYSKGKFYILLPEQLCIDLQYGDLSKNIVADTEVEVLDLFQKMLRDWEHASKKIEKVILFKAQFQGAMQKKTPYVPQWRPYHFHKDPNDFLFACNDLSFDSAQLGLSICWGVYEKTTVLNKSSYHHISGRVTTHGLNDRPATTEILWSEQREKTFMELDQAFASLIAKIYKVFGEMNAHDLEIFLDSNIKLLA